MGRLISLSVLLACIASAGCLGGRIGFRHDYKSGTQTGLYGGFHLQAMAPQPGFAGEEVRWLAGGDFLYLAGPGPNRLVAGPVVASVSRGIDDGFATMGQASVGIQFGADQPPRALFSLCGGTVFVDGGVLQTTVCGRVSESGWWGLDAGAAVAGFPSGF